MNAPTANATPSTESAAIDAHKSKTGAGINAKLAGAYLADPTRITRREGWNPRFDFGEIAEMAKSIEQNSVLNALRVKRIAKSDPRSANFDFELIDGDRRLAGLEHLLKTKKVPYTAIPSIAAGIPIILVDRAQDDTTSLIQMFVANQGKPFLPLEEAMAYKRMMDGDEATDRKGMTPREISKAIGKDETHIREMLLLLEADEDVKEAVAKGTINKQTAKEIAVGMKGDKAAQKKAIADIKAAVGGKTGKDAKKVSKAAQQKAIQAARDARKVRAGKQVIKAISKERLAELGEQVAKHLAKAIKDLGMEPKMTEAAVFREWITKDDKLAAAAAFGALEALKLVAGVDDIDLLF